jgi:glycosyltransferase involved in cell wall biosynthesis
MFRNRTVSLVIPAYNEEATIQKVVEEFRGEPHIDEIVVVDNNCSDRTAEFAAAAGLQVKSIKDVTPIPHNGCRPPKRRRV